MSLATRCIACGTIFRVTRDQLEVSEGWVRCGRCDEIFNALHGLFDLEHEAPPPWGRRPVTGDPGPPETSALHNSTTLHDLPSATLVDLTGESVPDIGTKSLATALGAQADLPMGNDPMHASPPEEPVLAEAMPEFMRPPLRHGLWQRRPVVAALWTAALVLSLMLALQATHHFRDLAAARWASLEPGLARWCALTQCVISAPRQIDSIAVESSALTRGSAPDSLRLAVTLRNRGPSPVAVPSIDLRLTDMAGQVIARRSLSPNDFRVAASSLQPGAELPLQSLLSVGNSLVAGYTVEVFFP